MRLDFTAIDFETANSNSASACSVGLVKVRDGVVVDETGWLIRPPAGYDDIQRVEHAHPRHHGPGCRGRAAVERAAWRPGRLRRRRRAGRPQRRIRHGRHQGRLRRLVPRLPRLQLPVQPAGGAKDLQPRLVPAPGGRDGGRLRGLPPPRRPGRLPGLRGHHDPCGSAPAPLRSRAGSASASSSARSSASPPCRGAIGTGASEHGQWRSRPTATRGGHRQAVSVVAATLETWIH